MAVVWLVRDRRSGEEHALKVVHAHLSSHPSARRRLLRELEASQRVDHPAVLPISELFDVDGVIALSMPACRGGTLQEQVDAHGPLDATALRTLLDRIGGALAAAHHAGVLHRDVTPGNVLLDGDSYRLADFGLARLADGHTATTTALGTPGYAAPEVWTDGARDPRSDAYGLGAVLSFAATGTPPYGGGSALEAIHRQIDGALTPLSETRPDLDPELCRTVDALLAPRLDDRPSVEDALRQVVAAPGPATVQETGDLQRTQVGSALSLGLLVALGWFQDLGGFLLSTIIDGHAIPKADVFQMTQGVAALLFLPLSLIPAIVGAVSGRRRDTTRRLSPWVGIGVLTAVHLAYGMLAGVVLPEMGMDRSADMFGTMLFHQGLLLPVVAAVLLLTRPWQGLRAPSTSRPAPATPLADRTADALALLATALKRAPDAIRVDIQDHVTALQDEVRRLVEARQILEAGRDALDPDPVALSRLEQRLARARTLGQDGAAALAQALATREATAQEAEALDAELTRVTARLLEIRAAASQARRALLELEGAGAVTGSLAALRARSVNVQQTLRALQPAGG